MENKLKEAYENVSCIRRPLVLIRGKDLTQEQLEELLLNEEPIFKKPDVFCRQDLFWNSGYCGIFRNVVHRRGFDWLDGWINQDGMVYGSYLLPKYPEKDEYFPGLEYLAKKYKYLDLVFTVIDSDESYCYWCDYVNDDKVKEKCPHCDLNCIPKTYDKLSDFIKEMSDYWADRDYVGVANIVRKDKYLRTMFSSFNFWYVPKDIDKKAILTIQLKDGEVTEHIGAGPFKEYDNLYGDFRYMMTQDADVYSYDEQENKYYVRFTRDFILNLFNKAGFSSEERNAMIKEVLPDHYMTSNEVLLTRELLKEEYDKYFKDTILSTENLKQNYLI